MKGRHWQHRKTDHRLDTTGHKTEECPRNNRKNLEKSGGIDNWIQIQGK